MGVLVVVLVYLVAVDSPWFLVCGFSWLSGIRDLWRLAYLCYVLYFLCFLVSDSKPASKVRNTIIGTRGFLLAFWIPACAGMTKKGVDGSFRIISAWVIAVERAGLKPAPTVRWYLEICE